MGTLVSISKRALIFYFSKMLNEATAEITKLVAERKWGCDPACIQKWVSKVVNQVNDRFQMHEVIHFVTEQQIQKCEVVLNADKLYTKSQFETKGATTNPKLQKPAETFQKELRGKQCPICKNPNVPHFHEQKRSSDEPGTDSYICPCGWRLCK
jgi:DNA-directed RNA polymerase subunit M/transcription elongation factor TFIIS